MLSPRKIPVLGRIFRKVPGPPARTYRGINSIRRSASPGYYPVRGIFRTAARTQHSEIQAIGLENIPSDGPVVLVGNHPNSFLDFFNLLTVVRHPISTAAKETLFKLPGLGYILRNWTLMIPIARKQDQKAEASEEARRAANEASIREAVETLAGGRLFNIFAEGKSTGSRKLNPIKLGFMSIAVQAEKEFNFNLNLRIVPFGLFYDRINKFQSSVCVVFGKSFLLKHLIRLPENVLSLDESEWSSLEKKIMVAGKEAVQKQLESLVISIPQKDKIEIIDECTSLYVLSPIKYMNSYNNIREKYRMSKTIADTILAAGGDGEGQSRLDRVHELIRAYRKKLKEAGLTDALVRRENTLSSFGYHVKGLIQGVIYSPLILYGFLFNYIPRLAGRWMRWWVIELKKRDKTDGDEKAIVTAFVMVLITYPIFGAAIFYLLKTAGIAWLIGLFDQTIHASKLNIIAEHPNLFASGIALVSIYLMARLWRVSLFYSRRVKESFYYFLDQTLEFVRRRPLAELRDLRYEIIDHIDFLISDYHEPG